MRLSIDPNDAGHTLFTEIRRRRQRVEVYFNGKKQHHAITVDSETGFIRRFVVRPRLHRVPDRLLPGRFLIEDLTGEVRIELGGAQPPVRVSQLGGSGSNASERVAAAQARRARKAARLAKIEASGGFGSAAST